MQNERRAAIRSEAKRLEKYFIASGAMLLEADSLLSAETLLDLYGEDIRARAYVTNDPVIGERMMRPDFTVPIVERHMSEGAEPARYTYNGPVWRMQDAGSKRETEFIQVGFELFDRSNSADSDAEVFSLFNDILSKNLQISTGDIGLLQSAVTGLNTTSLRKAALMRHLWRPLRFQNLIEQFSKTRIENNEKIEDMFANLSEEDIKRMQEDAELHAEEDKKRKEEIKKEILTKENKLISVLKRESTIDAGLNKTP